MPEKIEDIAEEDNRGTPRHPAAPRLFLDTIDRYSKNDGICTCASKFVENANVPAMIPEIVPPPHHLLDSAATGDMLAPL
jgi:hypothetical protein